MKHIRAILRKEWEDALHNRLVLYVVLLAPLALVIIPIVMLFLMGRLPVSQSDMEELGRVLGNPLFQGMTPAEAMQSVMASNMLVLFLMIPILVPVTIASYSIVGEKVTRSLEPLLATPLSTMELLLGKGLAAALPGIIMAWIAYAIFLVFARFLAVTPRVFGVFTDSMWLVALFILGPLLTLMAVMVGIIVSSRVSDPRSAKQLGALVVLPLMLLFIGGLSGLIALSDTTFLLSSLIVALVDVALIYFAVKLFQRETILTRWK